MEMKPLKSIGVRVEPDENSATRFEPYTTFTDKQRRELVRAAIVRWNAYSRRVAEPSVEEFLKSEGL